MAPEKKNEDREAVEIERLPHHVPIPIPQIEHRYYLRERGRFPRSTTAIPPLTTILRCQSPRSRSGFEILRSLKPVPSEYGAVAAPAVTHEYCHKFDLAIGDMAIDRTSLIWKKVDKCPPLKDFIDNYLQFTHRWYDLPHRPREEVPCLKCKEDEEVPYIHKEGEEVVDNPWEQSFHAGVLSLLYRLCEGINPETCGADSGAIKPPIDILVEKGYLELPMLMDVCAVYIPLDGCEATARIVVTTAMSARKKLIDDISSAVVQFLSIVDYLHARCISLSKRLASLDVHDGYVYRHPHGACIVYRHQVRQEFVEVMDFINDAVVTLDAFTDAYRAAAFLFCHSDRTCDGNKRLLNTLVQIHDSLLPILLQGFSSSQPPVGGIRMRADIAKLSMRVVVFAGNLLDYCCLKDNAFVNEGYVDDDLSKGVAQAACEIISDDTRDPAVRGKNLTQSLHCLLTEADQIREDPSGVLFRRFLPELERNFELASKIPSLMDKGSITGIDDELLQLWFEKTASTDCFEACDVIQRTPEETLTEALELPDKELFFSEGKMQYLSVVQDWNPSRCLQQNSAGRVLQKGTLEDAVSNCRAELEHLKIPPPKLSRESFAYFA